MPTLILLTLANVLMTVAWYWHLKGGPEVANARPLGWVILISWLLAGIEYTLAVPANRIGFASGMSLAQLKITQEVITLSVFVPFAFLFMDQPLKLDFLWAALCLVGAVYFVFRSA